MKTYLDFWLCEKISVSDALAFIHKVSGRPPMGRHKKQITLLSFNWIIDLEEIENLWLIMHIATGEPIEWFVSTRRIKQATWVSFRNKNLQKKMYLYKWEMHKDLYVYFWEADFVEEVLSRGLNKESNKKNNTYIFENTKPITNLEKYEKKGWEFYEHEEIKKLREDKYKLYDLQFWGKIKTEKLLRLYDKNKNLFYRLHHMVINKKMWYTKYVEFINKNF